MYLKLQEVVLQVQIHVVSYLVTAGGGGGSADGSQPQGGAGGGAGGFTRL